MNKEKFLTISVVFLLVLNAGIIGYLFFSRPPRPPEVWKIVVDRVDFDEQQTEQYLIMRDEHRQSMNKLDDEFASVLSSYLEKLKSSPDAASEAILMNRLAEIEKQKAEHTLNHFRRVKSLCKEGQTAKFDELIPDLMRVMLPPKNPHASRRKP